MQPDDERTFQALYGVLGGGDDLFAPESGMVAGVTGLAGVTSTIAVALGRIRRVLEVLDRERIIQVGRDLAAARPHQTPTGVAARPTMRQIVQDREAVDNTARIICTIHKILDVLLGDFHRRLDDVPTDEIAEGTLAWASTLLAWDIEVTTGRAYEVTVDSRVLTATGWTTNVLVGGFARVAPEAISRVLYAHVFHGQTPLVFAARAARAGLTPAEAADLYEDRAASGQVQAALEELAALAALHR